VNGARETRSRAGIRLPPCIVRAGFVIAVTISGEALALDNDRLSVAAGEELTRDDNVFRVAPQLAPPGGGGDTYWTTSAGFKWDVPVAAQRVVGNLTFNRQRFDRFQTLDLDGHDGSFRWLWSLGRELDGALGYSDRVALTSLANVQSGVQSATPNVLSTRETKFETTYRPAAYWRVLAGWRATDYSNGAIEYRISDANIDAVDAQLQFVTRADDGVGLAVRATDGRLPNRQLVGTTLVDNSYRENAFAFVLDWTFTGSSRVAARAGHLERSYEQIPQRGYVGPMYDARYEWRPGPRIGFQVAATRGLSEHEEVQVGYVVARGVSGSSSFTFSERLSVALGAERSHRTYGGDAAVLFAGLPQTSEHVVLKTATISYRPIPKVELTFGLRQVSRASNLQYSSYDANAATIGARVTF
jgi:hypothetical protein